MTAGSGRVPDPPRWVAGSWKYLASALCSPAQSSPLSQILRRSNPAGDLAAWIGLVPRQNSSGGKEKLGGITKQGDRYLRQLLVVGALAVIRYAQRHGTKRPWLVQLLSRRTPKIAAVALANKMARMIWAMMMTGERYTEPTVAAALASSRQARSLGRAIAM